ncbi:MAG: DinB family protein [Planctomycetota bacterium]
MKREHLIHQLQAVGQSSATLLGLCPRDRLEFLPGEGMRSLGELADHAAAQPLVDLAILQGTSAEVTQTIEETLHTGRPQEWVDIYERGIRAVVEYFESMPEDDFETRSTRAHYGTARPQSVWLLDLITHAYHHRGQVYVYLKMLGLPVDVEHLYT